jgi:16S rRNA (cytidine1402-2'-O)-methyltransferase
MTGTLYVVATPLGNLEDLSRRAERVLAEVAYVAAEDTRRGRELLSWLGIKKPLLSYYQPREESAIPRILELLRAGSDVALITDGGTPAISDPGYRLARAALEAGIRVSPIPGPSALAAALSAAGLPTDRVTFAGFLPPRSKARRDALAELAGRRDTLVFYESPRRVVDFLRDALAVLGDREAVVFRELTKVFEEQLRGRLSELAAALSARPEVKGEVTVLIRGAEEQEKLTEAEAERLLAKALAAGKPLGQAAAEIARLAGRPRKEIYALGLKMNKA